MLLSLSSSPVAIPRRGPTLRDIPQTTISKIPPANLDPVRVYLDAEEVGLYDKRAQASELDEDKSDTEDHLPTLENVPKLFFDNDFALNNPKTYAASSSIDISEALDGIELHLSHQLYKKASALGEAFVEVKETHARSKSLAQKLNGILASLEDLLKSSNNDDLLVLLVKRTNIIKLQLAQLHLISISKSLNSIKLAINDANLDDALELLLSTWPLIEELPRSNTIVMASNQLKKLLETVGHGYANLMVETVLRDVLLVEFDSTDAFRGILVGENIDPIISEASSTAIVALVGKLDTCGEIQYAFKLLHESIISHFRSVYKSNFEQDETISELTPAEFEAHLIGFIAHFDHSCRLLNNLKSTFLSIDLPKETQFLDITPSITIAINYIIKRMARALKIREPQSIRQSLPFFLRYNKLCNIMLRQCEILSSGMANDGTLRQLVDFQLKSFISDFHKSSRAQAQHVIRRELWKDEGLPNDLQTIIDEITSPQKELVNWTKGFNMSFNNEPPLKTDTESRKTLIINDQSFILPPSINPLLHTIKAYLILNSVYPQYTPITHSYLPDTLNTINDTIHASVLGTEAMKTAGLKHISTRVVALAAEVCRFWSEVSNQLLRFTSYRTFESIKTKFNDQLIAYYEKLVSIMHDVILKLITAENYMEEVIKKILSIAKSIHRYFPDVEYQMLMSRIFLDYEEVLSEFFMRSINDSNREKFQADVKYFMDKLGDVVGESGVGKRLWALVGGNKVVEVETNETEEKLDLPEQMDTREASVSASMDGSEDALPALPAAETEEQLRDTCEKELLPVTPQKAQEEAATDNDVVEVAETEQNPTSAEPKIDTSEPAEVNPDADTPVETATVKETPVVSVEATASLDESRTAVGDPSETENISAPSSEPSTAQSDSLMPTKPEIKADSISVPENAQQSTHATNAPENASTKLSTMPEEQISEEIKPAVPSIVIEQPEVSPTPPNPSEVELDGIVSQKTDELVVEKAQDTPVAKPTAGKKKKNKKKNKKR